MKNYGVFKLNEVHPDFKGLDDGMSLNSTESGLMLLITFSNPSPIEVENIQQGRVECKALLKNGMVMFFIKFGCLDWWETTLRLKSDSIGFINPFAPDEDDIGYALHVILADPITGAVRALRMFALGNHFSKELYKMVQQGKVLDDRQDFMREVFSIQRNYTTKELMKMTNLRYVVGTKC